LRAPATANPRTPNRARGPSRSSRPRR
jgi:hypothetical protein